MLHEMSEPPGKISQQRKRNDAEVARLNQRVEDLEEALQELMDWQNGPPLVTYTKGWTAAMEKACTVLGYEEAIKT